MTAPARPVLTARQTELLRLVADGLTYPEIAARWCVDLGTVRNYSARLRTRLGAHTIAHAVLLACRAGLLDGRPQRHGDHAGFAAHKYRDEEPCEACVEGERAYRAERRAARAVAA
ncbi:helix-turn-helix transcriptional regulator [Streptomyces lavendulae]|uniref:response regulator transcription factor n=1 Tax=Streptomyces lavendulae TaxID=1914 RepID=UPI0031E7595B